MQKLRNKIAAVTIAILFAFSMVVSMTQVNAHSPAWQIPTYSFINVAPNPTGVGEQVTVNFWLNQPPPTASTVFGDRWTNMTVKVTHPDGTTETLGPFTSDDTGGTFTLYTPTVVGNYTFQMIFGGQTLAGNNLAPGMSPQLTSFIGDYYVPSVSQIVKLIVQQEPTTTPPQAPLPTNYWTRPMTALNSNWYTIGGNWLGLGQSTFSNTGMYNASGNYNPYTTAPNTPHILWTKPGAFGGQVGGEFGGTQTGNYYSTSQYEPKYDPVIMNGILYYTEYPGSNQEPAGIAAVDLRTGQTLWTIGNLNSTLPAFLQQPNNYGNLSTTGVILYTTTLRCGEIINPITPNQYGALAYLWVQQPANVPLVPNTGISYGLYDAMTGNWILNIVNGTSMTLTEDDSGDLIGYYVNTTSNTLNMWNSTQAILYPNGQAPGFNSWFWRSIQGSIIQFSRGIMWSVPLPTKISGNSVGLPSYPFGPFAISVVSSGVVVCVTQNAQGTAFYNPGWQAEAGFNAITGQQLWLVNQTEEAFTRIVMGTPTSGNGIYIVVSQDSMTLRGYNVNTGQLQWTTQLTPFNSYDSDGVNYVVANGIFYIWGLGGDVWSVNMATGKVNWYYSTGSSGTQTPYGVWPLWTFSVGTVADGKLYVPEGHMYSPPLFHGAQQLALNITNGQPIWNIDSFDVTSGPAIADGIMTTFNAYDNLIYAYAIGPSKVTVTAPNVGVTTSTPITISGAVTDISAGATQQAVAANFPNGLPCVSDASMRGWMESVYMQQPMPTNATGVPVTVNVVDSNGNYRTIGTATSNIYGTYSLTWTPDIPGNYTVIANFAGTQSYYPSSAATAFYASAPAATPAPTAATASNLATTSDLMLGIAIIALIIIVIGAILVVLTLKKRP